MGERKIKAINTDHTMRTAAELAKIYNNAPSAEEVQRSEFEAWWRQENVDDDGAFTCGEQAAAWSAWQAARALKEGK